jgi:hypothetical protein
MYKLNKEMKHNLLHTIKKNLYKMNTNMFINYFEFSVKI